MNDENISYTIDRDEVKLNSIYLTDQEVLLARKVLEYYTASWSPEDFTTEHGMEIHSLIDNFLIAVGDEC